MPAAAAARVSVRRRGGAVGTRARAMAAIATMMATLITHASAFYLPGVAPQDFAMGDPIALKVNKLASVKTQLPFDFYSLPFCRPDRIVPSAENLGEVLRGDRIKNSAYEIAFKVDQACKVLCVKGPLTAEEAEQFSKAVAEEYRWYAIMDNLPLVTPIDPSSSASTSSSSTSTFSAAADEEGTSGGSSGAASAAVGGTAGGGFDRGLPVGYLETGDVDGGGDDESDDESSSSVGVGDELALDDVAAEKRAKKKQKKKDKRNKKNRKPKRDARIYNHVSFVVRYSHPDPETGLSRIVGFEAKPSSVRHRLDAATGKISAATCDENALPRLAASFSSSDPSSSSSSSLSAPSTIPVDVHPAEAEEGETVVFSYDVAFAASDVEWATRWNEYLNPAPGDGRVHWFSVLNSLAVVAFLAAMVGAIVARALRADIAAYNALDSSSNGGGGGGSSLAGLAEDAADESGWKLLHGDVFRPCRGRTLLAAGAGAGAQLAATLAGTLAFAVAGFLSPANRGALGTAAPLLFAGSGLAGGYASSRVYKLLRGPSPARATAAAAFLFPSAVGGVGLAMNAAAAGAKSSGAVPFSTLSALVALWLALSTPLVFAGAWIGYRKPLPPCPVRVNKIPRQVPVQPAYLHPAASALAAGVVVFAAVFLEFYFVLVSIWGQRFYYLFGFLVLATAVALLTAAEIAVVLCYFQLCAEDYRWWWRAFLNGGGVAAYIFAYSAFHFFTRLEISKAFVPSLLYFGYMACVSLSVFCLTGSVGLWACLKFVRSIYAAVKID